MPCTPNLHLDHITYNQLMHLLPLLIEKHIGATTVANKQACFFVHCHPLSRTKSRRLNTDFHYTMQRLLFQQVLREPKLRATASLLDFPPSKPLKEPLQADNPHQLTSCIARPTHTATAPPHAHDPSKQSQLPEKPPPEIPSFLHKKTGTRPQNQTPLPHFSPAARHSNWYTAVAQFRVAPEQWLLTPPSQQPVPTAPAPDPTHAVTALQPSSFVAMPLLHDN